MAASNKWSVRAVVGSSAVAVVSRSVRVTDIVGAGWVLYELRDDSTGCVRSYSVGGISVGLGISSAAAATDQSSWSSFQTTKSLSLDSFDYLLTTVKTAELSVGFGYCRCTIEWMMIQQRVGILGRLWHCLMQSMPAADLLTRSGDEVNISGALVGAGAAISVLVGPSLPMSTRCG